MTATHDSPADARFDDLTAHSPRTAAENVAILLLALGSPMSARLLQLLEPSDVKTVMSSASSLGPIDRDDLDLLIDDFAAHFARTLGISTGFDSVRNLVAQALTPDQLESLLSAPATSAPEPIWHKFASGSENSLVPYLLDEHPQTVAYILSQLDADLAARCLAMLPRDLRNTVVKRLLKLQPVHDRPSRLVQDCLHRDLLVRTDAAVEEEGRIRVAKLMNKLDREQSSAIIDCLAEIRPKEAKRLRDMIFSFEDIGLLSQSARLALFDKVPTDQVVLALRGMPGEFKDMVLTAMGARSRRMVEAELAGDNGQVRKESLAARRAIADTALSMAARGEIVLAGEGSG
jgi:flagellar motor switch protein FliG